MVIICSNYNPDTWYPNDSAKEAILRRRTAPCGRTIHIPDHATCDAIYKEFNIKRPRFEYNQVNWACPISTRVPYVDALRLP